MEQFINDLTVWAAAADWLRIVLTFLVMVGVPLLVVILMLFGSEKLIIAARKVYQQIRPQFDQVTDPLVLAIAARTGLTAEQVVQFLTSPDGILLKMTATLVDAHTISLRMKPILQPEAIAGELVAAEAPDLDALANLAAEKAVAKFAHEAQGREAVR